MADLDLARVKRNVAKMAGMNAPVEDIDGYIASEGTTVDAVRAFKPDAPAGGMAADDPRFENIRRAKENLANGIRPAADPASHREVDPDALAQARSPTPTYGGAAMNTTAGVNEGLYSTIGLPVDAMRGAMNLGIRGVNAATGSEIAQISDDNFGGSKSIGRMMGVASPALNPENTKATTTADRIARGTGQAVGSTIAPQGVVGGLARAELLAPRAAETAGRILGNTNSVGAVVGNAAIGGVAGASGSAAMEAAPDEYKPVAGLVGSLLGGGAAAVAGAAPSLLREGGRIAGDALAPLSASGRERLAGEQLRSASSDPTALRAALDAPLTDLVQGSKPTTFQATGDMGIGVLERGQQTKYPAEFNQRRAEQNTARVGDVTGLQADGSPETVAAAVRGRLKMLDDQTQQLSERAAEAARARVGALGEGMAPETAGNSLRGSLQAARDSAKASERQLWTAVDPDGSLIAPATKTRSAMKDILENLPVSARAPEGEELAIHGIVQTFGESVPFREIAALRSRLNDALRSERTANGESQTYRRLSSLRGALENDLDGVISAKAATEAEAVAAGTMAFKDTIAAKLQGERESWLSGRQALAGGDGSGGSPVGYASGGSAPIPGLRGTASENARGLGPAASDPRLEGGQPTFDAAARDRLTAANTATRERAQTFDNKALGPILKRPMKSGPYDMPATAVAQRVFMPGPKGFENIQTYRQAVGDQEALDALQGFAVDRLRNTALRDDGTFDPVKVDAFRRTHADALRAFPDLDRQFSDAASASQTMVQVGLQRKTAMDEAQRSVLGKFVGVDHPEDVTSAVGRIFGAQDSVKRMVQLRRAVNGNAEAEKGLRKAIVDHMTAKYVGNTEAATTGIGTVKSDGFQTFVKQNQAALRAAGFGDDEMKMMARVAEDLQRANRSIASVKNPGGSNTAQDTLQVQKTDSGKTVLAKVVSQFGAPGAGAASGFAVGGPVTAALGAVGAGVIAEMRRQGLAKVDDIVADALLNPARARVLLSAPTSRATEESTFKVLGRLYRQSLFPAATVTARATATDSEINNREARR